MKFSSHPFCVSEGIPVRQEVPSRNRRKRKKKTLLRRKRKEERTRSAWERDVGRRWKWRWSEAVRGLRDIGRGEVGSKGNCQQSSDCIVVPKGKVHRPLENLLTYGNRTHLPFTLLFAAR